eukprot:6765751-Pyramimonas_sp.AAC.1
MSASRTEPITTFWSMDTSAAGSSVRNTTARRAPAGGETPRRTGPLERRRSLVVNIGRSERLINN